MALKVTCRDCGHVNQVDMSRSSQKYLCGGCGVMGTLPAAQGEVGDSAESSVVRFKCPSCGMKYATKPEMAGKKIRCKGCGAGVRVPGPGPRSRALAIRNEIQRELFPRDGLEAGRRGPRAGVGQRRG